MSCSASRPSVVPEMHSATPNGIPFVCASSVGPDRAFGDAAWKLWSNWSSPKIGRHCGHPSSDFSGHIAELLVPGSRPIVPYRLDAVLLEALYLVLGKVYGNLRKKSMQEIAELWGRTGQNLSRILPFASPNFYHRNATALSQDIATADVF